MRVKDHRDDRKPMEQEPERKSLRSTAFTVSPRCGNGGQRGWVAWSSNTHSECKPKLRKGERKPREKVGSLSSSSAKSEQWQHREELGSKALP